MATSMLEYILVLARNKPTSNAYVYKVCPETPALTLRCDKETGDARIVSLLCLSKLREKKMRQ